MKIPTPTLIKELRQPVRYIYNDNNFNFVEKRRVEKLMEEAAAQLEWFLDYANKKTSG